MSHGMGEGAGETLDMENSPLDDEFDFLRSRSDVSMEENPVISTLLSFMAFFLLIFSFEF